MKSLIRFIENATCAATTVRALEEAYAAAGFTALCEQEHWSPEPGGAYYVNLDQTGLVAFRVGRTAGPLRIISGHTDQPSLRVKPQPEIGVGPVTKLNVSVYGSPIFYSWLDRPLSLAGRVVWNDLSVTPVDFQKPMLVIPSLAIHLNRDVNKGIELNPQKDLQPLFGLCLSDEALKDELAKLADRPASEILDYELFAYVYEKPQLVGAADDFLVSPRLDDLCMVFAAAQALIDCTDTDGIAVNAFFDNEEIGSRTPQGGDSARFTQLLERIALSLGETRETFLRQLPEAFLLSADVAHAFHPNCPEAYDPKVYPVLGAGLTVKLDASMRYMTRLADYTRFEKLLDDAKIARQTFISRADKVSGSTLGPVMSAFLPCRIVDVGTPILAMHSAVETMAAIDYENTKRAMQCFYHIQ